MYLLAMGYEPDDSGQIYVEFERFLEYTEPHIKELYKDNYTIINEFLFKNLVKSIWGILTPEISTLSINDLAIIGRFEYISLNHKKEIVLRFIPSKEHHKIPVKNLDELSVNFGIEEKSWEKTRTHVSLKEIDISEILTTYTKSYKDLYKAVQENETKIDQLHTNLIVAEKSLEKVTESVDSYEKTFYERMQDLESSIQRQTQEKFSEFETNKLDFIQKYEDEYQDFIKKGERLLQTAALGSTAEYYKTYSSEEKRSADMWRIGAILLFILSAVTFFTYPLIIHQLTPASQELTAWENIFQKLFTTAGFAAAATYCARESSHHRTEARQAKATELTLAVAEPFISNMEAQNQEEIRLETARKLFTRTPQASQPNLLEKTDEDKSPSSSTD